MKKIVIAVASILSCVSAQAKDLKIGSWTIERIQDSFTKQPRIIAGIRTQDGEFAIACESGLPFIRIFLWNERFNPDDAYAFALRIDQYEPTQSIFGVISTRTLGNQLSKTTYKKFLNASEIVVRIQFSNAGLQDYKFNATKTSEAMKPILRQCPVEDVADADLVPFDPKIGLQSPEEARASVRRYRDKKKNEKINANKDRS